MTTIRIKVTGDERVAGKLTLLSRRLANLNWLWLNTVELFVRKEQGWFSGKAGWAPLSPTYAAWKAVHFPGQPVMVATGDLRASLTSPNEAVLAETPRSLFLGTSVPYAAFHATGTNTMPRRPPAVPAVSLLGGIAARLHYEIRRVWYG